jgi:hypothetical protein
MGNLKYPTEGGSGGKRGHSNMEHAVYSEEHKEAGRVRRRTEKKKQLREALSEERGGKRWR